MCPELQTGFGAKTGIRPALQRVGGWDGARRGPGPGILGWQNGLRAGAEAPARNDISDQVT